MTAEEVAAGLLDRVLDAPGGRAVHAAVSWLHAVLDADRVEVHLLDRRRERLHLAAVALGESSSTPVARHLEVRESAAGQALLDEGVLSHRVAGCTVHHIPLEAFGHNRGVLTITQGPVSTGGDQAVAFGPAEWRRLGRTLAVLLHQAGSITDELELVSRTYQYSIAAELQWQLLPPIDVATDRFALRAVVEPAPRVTSDLFDWSLNGDRLTIAVLDAAGRGLIATQVGDLALAALRHARRSGLSIAEQAALADQALWDRHHGHATVHILLLEIDLAEATATAVHAGSPIALRRRRGEVELLDLGAAHDPLGLLDRSRYDACRVDVRPGDVLLLLTDGVTAARGANGQPYGLEGVAHHLERTGSPRNLPSWLIGDLRGHAGGDLEDDATALAFEWHHR